MKNNGKTWTEVEDRFIRIYYPKHGPSISKTLNRTRGSVKHRASLLHISVNPEYKTWEHPITDEEKERDVKWSIQRYYKAHPECKPSDDMEKMTKDISCSTLPTDTTECLKILNEINLANIRKMSFRYKTKERSRCVPD